MPRKFALLALTALLPLANAAQVPFLQDQTTNTIRNNYSGFVGMQFTVGSAPLNVASLGRLYLPGNNQTHTVKLVNAQNGVDVPGAAAQVTMTAGAANSYQYAALATPIQLTAGKSYFLVSQEMYGGDTWYDYTPVTSTEDASVNGPVYLASNGSYSLVSVSPTTSWSYVPANFQYSLSAVVAPPTVSITQPLANATLSGSAAIAATAAASAGLSVVSVQFELNGSPIGAAVLKSPYQVNFDTTTLTDGVYTLTAVATDSAGNPATSSPVTLTFSNGNAPMGMPFVTAASFGTLRNNYSGFVGMEFTVGTQALTINAVGRIFVAGNTGTHTVKLVNASTGQDVAGGSAQINMAGGSSFQFKYQSLTSPLTLPANASYYLVSQETAGGDQWYDYGPLTIAGVATVPGAVYGSASGFNLVPSPSDGYVPLSFLYASGSTTTHAPPVVSVTSPAAGSVSGTVTFSAQAMAATGLQITSLQLVFDGFNFGNANTAASATSTVSAALVISTISNGTHTLTAVGTDSAGQTTTSAVVLITVANGGSVPASAAIITAQTLAGPLRSNFTGAVGLQFTTGTAAITATQLGRFCAAGNTRTHSVKLVQSNGIDVAGGSAQVYMAGCAAGQYTYGNLSSSITLPANTTYYLVSLETAGGDQWYDYAPVTVAPVVSAVVPVYSPGSGYFAVPSPGSSYVPVNLQYATTTVLPPTVAVTTPAANATVSGTITLSATATAAGGLSLSGVQFQQNGTNIGAIVSGTGPTYSIQLDTTTLLNGTYSLTAIATDSAGNTATSSSVPITISNAGSTVGTTFITQQTPGPVRNNFSGYVGMQFTVGGASLTVAQLGRLCVAGNTGSHVVELVNSDGTSVAGGSINLPMTSCTPGSYRYRALGTALTLSAGATYDLLSLETAGGDQWYDFGPVTSQTSATINGPVYVSGSIFNLVAITGSSYVPVNFIYTKQLTAPPSVSISSPAPLSVLSGLVTVTANATAASGLSIASVQLQRTGTDIGPAITAAGPYYSATLDTRLLANGGYTLSAIAIDSAGNETFGNSISVSVYNNIATPTVTITTPKSGSTGTATISVTAIAVPAAGTTLSSLQFRVDGQSFGAPCATASCTAVLDTTLLPNGTHALTATAIDSDEGQSSSAPVSINANNTLTGIGMLNGFIPGVPRNYGDFIGMKFTTGCAALTVNSLGRIYVPGNTGTHLLKLVLASNGTDVTGGAATVSFTGAIANRIAYAPLSAPITLSANTAYYLVSQETATGDRFYDYEPILTNGAVAVNGPAYLQNGTWNTPQNPNYIYVPVDFKFTVPGVPFPGPATFTTPGTPPTSTSGIVPAGYNHILVNGQSLSIGTTGGPPLSLTQPYLNVMLNNVNSAFLPLTEGAGIGFMVNPNVETIGSALGNTMTRLSPGLSFTGIVSNAGVSGYSYAQLAKGTAPYTAAITQLNAANTLSLAAKKTYKFSGVALMHGETDEDLGTSAAAYEADLVQWQGNFQTDGKTISGQSDSVPFFIDQENSWTYSNLATPTVALGQLSAAVDNPSSIFLIAPKYQYHYNDGIHMDNVSYREHGEQFGKVISEVLLNGASWKPFAPKSVTRSGNVVTAQFNVPAPPLQFDTSTVLPKSAMGFEYNDGSACSPFIVSAQITASDTVTLTLSAVPAGSNEHLRYAFTGIAGSPAGRDQPGSAHGNLKDSDSTASAYGNDLSNWAVAFDQLVVIGAAPNK